MGEVTYAIPGFLGGQISAFAQGRFDKPDYRVSLNVCLNSFPVETGPWTRRPGTAHAGHTRRGAAGRVIKFDFEQSNAVTLELTDGWLRTRTGANLVVTNDSVGVLALSAANPAVIQTALGVTWSTADTLLFTAPSIPLLQNRQFTATKINSTHFSIADALTGLPIDGSTLVGSIAGLRVSRVQELATPYLVGGWSSVRSVQAETTSVLLAATVAPQALTVTTLPSSSVSPVFAMAPAVFNDGPYLDPFINGVLATPNAKTGIIALTLSFPAYVSTKAYATGSFVTSSGVNYVSLQDQNVGNTPVSSPTFWAASSAGAAINNGQGFLGTDIGRAVRLLSEPSVWDVGTTYGAAAIVTYNPTGVPGASTYWQSTAGANTGNIPGADLTHWQLITTGAAIWTWGKITSLSNIIDRALAGSFAFGSTNDYGGGAAAFDGVFSKSSGSSAGQIFTGGVTSPGVPIAFSSFIGKNYSGASAQKIQQATVYPTIDAGYAFGSSIAFNGVQSAMGITGVTFNLRGKSSAPSGPADGTLLGSSGLVFVLGPAITIISNDQASTWNYVWIEQITIAGVSYAYGAQSYSFSNVISQVSFFSPTGTGTSSGVNVQILGPALLYTNSVSTWRLGVYSGTTGYPTCGTYHEGRLWLGGAVANRFDACVSNGIVNGTVNFAPTDQNGTVAANNAISYTLNSDGVNPIFWMKPDLQGVVCGTQQGEWLVQAPTNGPIAPNNIAARRMTKNGSSNVDPARTENSNLFVKRYARKLLEYFADAYSGKYSAPNLADKAVITDDIVELAYVEAVTPIVWMRDAANALLGMTYRRTTISTQQPPDFYAHHVHTLGTGRVVESICSGPSVGGDLDALTMVTNDLTTNIRHVEILTDTPDEATELADAWQLDDAVIPASTSQAAVSTTLPYGGLIINGLWHLNDQTVQVFAGGLDCGDRGDNKSTFTDFVVANGSITVPYGDSVGAGPGRGLFTADFVATGVQIVVGATFNSDGQLVRAISPADSGNRNGPALGLVRRNHRYAMLLSGTRGISVGATFDKMYPVQLRQDNDMPIGTLDAFSGIAQDPVQDSYSYDGMLCWRVARPFPANLVAISGNIATQGQ